MLWVILRWYRVLCTDLVFILRLNKTLENLNKETVDEGCASSHRLKWGPFPPNEVDRIAQPAREGEKEGK